MDRNFNDERDPDLDTALEKFENEQLDLPSAQIRHENGAF